jgi:hypothetical protein
MWSAVCTTFSGELQDWAPYLIFFLWRCDPAEAMASSFLRFVDHTQRRTTVGRTPLDEWSARRRDFYLATHNADNNNKNAPGVCWSSSYQFTVTVLFNNVICRYARAWRSCRVRLWGLSCSSDIFAPYCGSLILVFSPFSIGSDLVVALFWRSVCDPVGGSLL